MPRKKYTSVDEYLADFSGETLKRLLTLRNLFKSCDPAVEERISYNIPAYFLRGNMIGYFAGFDHHVSLYPGRTQDRAFTEETLQYLSGRSTLKFLHAAPLPLHAIKQFINIRLKEARKQ